MAVLLEKIKTNPIVVIALVVTGLIQAGYFTLDDVSAFFAVVASVVVVVSGFVGRHFVTPNARADARAQKAYEDVQVEGHPGNPFGNV